MLNRIRIAHFLSVLFFAFFLLVGLSIYRTFGVHIDEYHNQAFGNMWGRYVDRVLSSGNIPPVNDRLVDKHVSHNLCHGPFWELSLYYIQKLFLRSNVAPRDIILTRHLANFLLFYVATIFFFFTCNHIFRDYRFSLMGTLLLILHPRIFADSFYNTVDLAFLSFSVISLYTGLLFLGRPRLFTAVSHGTACAILVDTRIAGLIFPFTTTLVFAVEGLLFTENPGKWRRFSEVLFAYLITLCGAMVLFWPFLWRNTVMHFFESLKGGTFPGNGFDSFYTLQWIIMTTPLEYLLMFMLGFVWLGLYCFHALQADRKSARAFSTALLLIVIPLEATIAADTQLFDGWRHHYFLYPPFVIICLFGLTVLKRCDRGMRLISFNRLGTVLVLTVSGFSVLDALNAIILTHPFQSTYVNSLAGRIPYTHSNYLRGILSTSSRALAAEDYWSVSNKQALTFILKVHPKDSLSVYFTRIPTKANNRFILPNSGCARVKLALGASDADYIIDDFDIVRRGILETEYGKLLKVFESQQIPICAVYKTRTGEFE